MVASVVWTVWIETHFDYANSPVTVQLVYWRLFRTALATDSCLSENTAPTSPTRLTLLMP
jgi:hypothetical protein